jgi:hypothetical protein
MRRKMLTKPAVLFTIGMLLAPGIYAKDQTEMALRWSELPDAVRSRKIRMMLPNGIHIEGKVEVVEPDQLRVKVTKTSDSKIQPKGPSSIPRSEVSVMQVVRHGYRWRIIGAIAGPVLTAGTAAAVVAHTGAGNLRVLVGSTSAGVLGTAVGGYFIGRYADRRIVTVRIVP